MLFFNAHPVVIIIILEVLLAFSCLAIALLSERKVTKIVNYVLMVVWVVFAILNAVINL